MRHICRFALFPAFFTLLSGCGDMENTGTSTFNPATNVDPTFSTFTLKDEDDIQNLKHTRFWDFYRGIEPNANDQAQDQGAAEALVTALRDHIDVIIGANREDAATEYSSVRNPLDLMNQVIASGEIANFQDGRRYISERIDEGISGVYSNRSNGATIRFTDQKATLNGAALANRVWIYPTLDWRYLPEGPEGQEGLDDKVYRTIQYVARSAPEGETATPPELVSVLAGTRYDARTFSTTDGDPTEQTQPVYNAPEFTEADYNTRSYGSLELRQDYVEDHYDEVYIRGAVDEETGESNLDNANHITVDGSISDCIKARLDYDMKELYVYTSSGEPINNQGANGLERNPNHCSQKKAGDETVIYSVQGVAERAQ